MHDGSTSRPDAEAQDSPIFDPDGWQLTEFEAELCSETRTLAQTKFAARAAEIDRSEQYPWNNVEDLKNGGFMGMTIPKAYGGQGRTF
ncbi:MAG: acyl-CoA dehydrogenase family protein, partial [Pseudomonadota bacterium]|nr:acyl-CoA dehydrogenase family protein [Pseudomonadota bacterium]